jgi:nitrogen fixation protein
MNLKRNKRITFWGFLVTLLGATVIYFASVAHGPDIDIVMVREFPSEVDIEQIHKAVSDISAWPQWFYSLKEAKMLDGFFRPLSIRDWILKPGAIVELSVDPKKGPWKRFTLLTTIVQYVPKKELSMNILKDSSGKLNTAFSRLDWKIEFEPHPKGTLIRSTVSARAIHWRSKLFGTIAKKILLTQVFYPDLLKLAGLKNVKSGISLSPTEQ